MQKCKFVYLSDVRLVKLVIEVKTIKRIGQIAEVGHSVGTGDCEKAVEVKELRVHKQ